MMTLSDPSHPKSPLCLLIGSSFISLERLKLLSSSVIHMYIGHNFFNLGMTNDPQRSVISIS